MTQRVQNAEVAFLKDNPYDTFPVTLDPGRLQQVLTNFVTNAVKYTKKGHIRVGYRKESRNIDGVGKDGLCFYCEDTGTGIPKEKQSSALSSSMILYRALVSASLSVKLLLIRQVDASVFPPKVKVTALPSGSGFRAKIAEEFICEVCKEPLYALSERPRHCVRMHGTIDENILPLLLCFRKLVVSLLRELRG